MNNRRLKAVHVVRIAVIGMGMMGTLHARVFHDMGGVDLAAAIDIDQTRLDAARHDLGVPVATSLAQVIDVVDAVSVTLPDHLHVDACVLALERGKYVLVEKPLAANSAQARTILRARQAPHQLMVGHLLRFDLRLQELKRRIDAGELGRLRYVRIHRSNTTLTAARLAGAVSVTSFLAIHDLDLLLWLTGKQIRRTRAAGKKIHGNTWDLSVAYLELADDIHAVVENHWLINEHSARSCLAGVQVFGDQGTATLDLSTDELEITTDNAARTWRVDSRNWTHDPQVTGGSLRRELQSFVDCVRNGLPMPVSGEDGLRAVEAVESIETAMATADHW